MRALTLTIAACLLASCLDAQATQRLERVDSFVRDESGETTGLMLRGQPQTLGRRIR